MNVFKRIIVIISVVSLSLTMALYKPQKTEALAITLSAIAITALIAAAAGIVVYNSTQADNTLNSIYNDFDNDIKSSFGQIEVESTPQGDFLNLKHSQIDTIVSTALAGLHNRYIKPVIEFVELGITTMIERRVGAYNANHLYHRVKTVGITPGSVGNATSDVTVMNWNGITYHAHQNQAMSIRIGTDTNGSLKTMSVSDVWNNPQYSNYLMGTILALNASNFGYQYLDKIMFLIVRQFDKSTGSFQTLDLNPNLPENVHVINATTIAIPLLKNGLFINSDGLTLNSTTDSRLNERAYKVAGTLPSIGGWTPDMELDPPTAQDLLNDRGYNGGLVLGGAAAAAGGAYGDLHPGAVLPSIDGANPPWDLPTVTPGDSTWDDVKWNDWVTSPDVTQDFPDADSVDSGNEVSWRVGIWGGLLGIGKFMSNLGDWLLGGLLQALGNIWSLIKAGFAELFRILSNLAMAIAQPIIDAINALVAQLVSALSSMFTALFIPSQAFIENWINNIKNNVLVKLGFLGSALAIITTLFSNMITMSPTSYVEFGQLFGGTMFIDASFIENNLNALWLFITMFIRGITMFALLSMLYNKFKTKLKGA